MSSGDHKVRTLVPTAGNVKTTVSQQREEAFLCLTQPLKYA